MTVCLFSNLRALPLLRTKGLANGVWHMGGPRRMTPAGRQRQTELWSLQVLFFNRQVGESLPARLVCLTLIFTGIECDCWPILCIAGSFWGRKRAAAALVLGSECFFVWIGWDCLISRAPSCYNMHSVICFERYNALRHQWSISFKGPRNMDFLNVKWSSHRNFFPQEQCLHHQYLLHWCFRRREKITKKWSQVCRLLPPSLSSRSAPEAHRLVPSSKHQHQQKITEKESFSGPSNPQTDRSPGRPTNLSYWPSESLGFRQSTVLPAWTDRPYFFVPRLLNI